MPKRILSTDPSLKDHKRIGKKLVAPLSPATTPRIRASERVIERIPEVIWIHELIHHLGPRRSLEALAAVVKAAHDAWCPGDIGMHVLASSWHYTRSEVIGSVVKTLRVDGQLEPLRQGLRPLIGLYPQYPLHVLYDTASAPMARECDLAAFKMRLQSLFDRFGRPAVMTHAHIVLAEARAGVLSFPQGFVFPNMDLIYATGPVDEDNTEFAHAAGFARSCAMNTFAAVPADKPLVTAKYFWSRGLALEKCGLQEEESYA